MKKMKTEAPKSLTEHAHASIRQYILAGNVDTEFRLTEDFFAKHLGISKSPIREALNSLQEEGLLRIEPRRGTYLRRFTAREVKDLYELREALEVLAAATTDINEELIAELEASVERTCRYLAQNDKARYIEEDIHFHASIVAGTGNRELQRVFSNIQNKLWLCRCQTYRLTSPDTPDSHREIARALRENDRERAQNVTRMHIGLVREVLIASMEEALEENAPVLEEATV